MSEATEATEDQSSPKAAAPPESEADSGVEGEGPAADGEDDETGDPDFELPASTLTAKRNLYSHNTFYIGGDFKDVGGEARGLIPVADVTNEVAATGKVLVEPESFDDVVAAIEANRMAMLTGRGCGNRVAAGAALAAGNRSPILELPADSPVKQLVDAVEQLCEENSCVGFLVHSFDPKQLAALAGFELRRLRGLLAGGRAAIVFTTSSDSIERSQAGELPVLAGIAPDWRAVLGKTAKAMGLPASRREQVEEACEKLPEPVSPGTVVELAELAAQRDLPAAELAVAAGGRSPALDEWLRQQPSARSVAAMGAAATLDGVPSGDFDSAAARLGAALEGEREPAAEEKRFGPADRGLPEGVVRFGRATVATHFGHQETEVVEIEQPHTRDRIVGYLWSQLDADFRRPFVEWLRDLPRVSSGSVVSAAAVTAGTLFAADPIAAERELIRPWALDGRPRQRYCAGLALGVPVARGADPLPARTLAKSWAESSAPSLLRAAIAAYGGPLGIWDPDAAAPTHLWRMAHRASELRRPAERALASLVAGGSEAARTRAAAIALLLAETEDKPVPPTRVYSLLPLLMARLSAGDRKARGSLSALVDGSEPESLTSLATLMAKTFDAPTGQRNAFSATRILLTAISEGRIDRDVLDTLVAEMVAAAAKRGRKPQFESQLARVLRAESRGQNPLREVASSVYDTFYGKP